MEIEFIKDGATFEDEKELRDEERIDYQINFIERLAALDLSIYDDMQEDVIKAISQCFANVKLLQTRIKKSL